MKKFVLIILLLNFLNSCGSVGEGFTLKKSNTGDEFLVEKKKLKKWRLRSKLLIDRYFGH